MQPLEPAVAVARTRDVLARTSAEELAREGEGPAVARFLVAVDRDDAIAARMLCRELLGDLGGDDLARSELTQVCTECGGPHGRPVVAVDPTVSVSWSHSTGWVMAAAVRAGRVGVDLERRTAPTRLDSAFRARILGPDEQAAAEASANPELAALQLWTGKEALVKVGLATPPRFRDVDISRLLSDAAASWQGGRITSRVHEEYAAALATLR